MEEYWHFSLRGIAFQLIDIFVAYGALAWQ